MTTKPKPARAFHFKFFPNRIRRKINFRSTFSKSIALGIVLSAFFSVHAQNIESKPILGFDEFKSAWMSKNDIITINDEQYEELKKAWMVRSSTNEPFDAKRNKKLREWQKKDLPDGFPVMQSTGDKNHDEAIYNAEKQIWIDNNPKIYKSMSSSPSKMTPAEREERNNTLNKK